MLILVSSMVCGAVYAALAVLLALHSRMQGVVVALVTATAMTSIWAFAQSAGAALEATLPGALEILEVLRVVGWLVFLGVAVRGGAAPSGRSWHFLALALALATISLALIVEALVRGSPVFVASVGTLEPAAHLALAILGLVWVEALLRRARSEGHDRTRYLCLGTGAVLAFEALAWSEVLLFHRVDASLFALTPTVQLLAAPLLGLGAARNQAFATELKLARRAVVHSATLFALGAYLLALAGAGALLQEMGGRWGRSLQLLSLFTGFLALAFVWASPSLRALLRFRLGSYLFTHRHDYREQWERFATALAVAEGSASGATRALRALADVIGSLWGGLWLRDGQAFILSAAQGVSATAIDEITQGPFTEWLEAGAGEVLEITPAQLASGQIPDGLAWGWVAIPLIRERLEGFVLLSRPRGVAALHPEDAELLRVAGLHAASSLLADQRARRLAEGQRFQELSRGLAFLAHDLRNVANELTLTLANARKHIARPEFQRDLILSMEESVRSMQRLLDKVARSRRDAPAPEPTDLARMVAATARMRRAGGLRVELDQVPSEPLPIATDAERLAALCGHLIQNAVDAIDAEGHVTVRLRRDGNDARLEVEDDGPGMAPEVLRDRLHHPFQSSKPGGFGLGLFECRELARELGGELTVESHPGRGTSARLRLPLAKRDDTPTREVRR